MADIIGGLTISSSSGYGVVGREGYGLPSPELLTRQKLSGDGSKLIRSQLGFQTRTLSLNIEGSDKDEVNSRIRAIQQEFQEITPDNSIAYKYTPLNSTKTNIANVWSGHVDVVTDWQYENNNHSLGVAVTLDTDPYWNSTQKTIAVQTASSSPFVLALGQIAGDYPTPAYIEIKSDTTETFGNNIYLGAKDNPLSTASFGPVKDYSGSSTGGTFGGQYRATAAVSNAAYTELTDASANDLYAVTHGSSAVAWCVGQGGVIFRTTDGGITWTQQTSPTANHLRAVWAASTNTVYAVGDNTTIIKTTNGVSWTTQGSTATGTLYCVEGTSGNVVFYGGNHDYGSPYGINGQLAKTTDGGATWTAMGNFIGHNDSVTDISVASSSQIWIGGDDNGGDFLGFLPTAQSKSSDFTDLSANLNSVWSVQGVSAVTSTGKIWVCGGRTYDGMYGYVYRSTDGGASFTAEQSAGATKPILNSIVMNSSIQGWTAGNSGTLKKHNGSSGWTSINKPLLSGTLTEVSADSTANAIVVGAGNTQAYTTKGSTWTQTNNSWVLGDIDDYRGSYRVLARVRTAASSMTEGSVRASAGWAGGTFRTGTAVNFANSTKFQWMDLGTFNIPPTEISSNLDPKPQPVIKLEAKGASAVANAVHTDVSVILPTGSGQVFIDDSVTDTKTVAIDTEQKAVHKSADIVNWSGALPMLQPGNNNIVVMASSGINSFTYSAKYTPRYGSAQ